MSGGVFDRLVVTDQIVQSSNLAEDDAPEYNAGATYAVDDTVILAALHTVYRSVQDGNVGNNPATDDGTRWVAIGATKYWKAFDETLSDQATNPLLIEYSFAPPTRISGMFLSNVDADEVIVTVTNGGQVVEVSKQLRNLDHVRGWYSWLFGGRPREPEVLFDSLPWMGVGTTYNVRISAATGDVAVGEIVLGAVIRYGTTPWGANIGIFSPSTKEKDIYGNDVIVRRATAQIARIPFQLTDKNPRRLQRLVQKFEAVPTVWIGDERPQYALVIFGVLKDYNHVLEFDDYSAGYIEVEGRT